MGTVMLGFRYLTFVVLLGMILWWGGYGGLLFPADDGGIEGECSTPGATLGMGES